jgi:sterol desaturase/sphingolipid hydroxylase (fatty acid hydroxylase superfamily)
MKLALSHVLWPGLLAGCIALTYLGLDTAYPIVCFNLVYLGLALILFMLERVLPHERSWLDNDGQIGPDLGHTLISKGAVQVVAATVVAMGIAQTVGPEASGLWPAAWPLATQVVLALVIAELGLYFAHRLAHEWPRLWCFHAVHHSVGRLWIINTGRFHFVDTMVSVLLSQPLLYFAGAPKPMFLWVAAITAFIGILTHCNIDMRSGGLNLVFNTPELHRWHHSRIASEGNTNYGENLMIFDHIFGTYFFPARRPPVNIGINNPMPKTLIAQLQDPFTWMGTGIAEISSPEAGTQGTGPVANP